MVASEPACQLIPKRPPPLMPVSDSNPQWVCSLPGLNRFLHLWEANTAMKLALFAFGK